MDVAQHGRLRPTGSPRIAVALFVVALSLAGYAVTMRAINDERGNAARRKAEVESLQVEAQLQRAGGFAVGLANALEGERVPNGRRFAALDGSAATSVGLTVAMWVERIGDRERRAYERRIGAPISQLAGRAAAPPATTYFPATFLTGVAVRPGADMAGLPALAVTLEDPTSVFAGTATPVGSLAGQRGFFVVQGAQFGQGPGSQGFLVVFVPADWLNVSLNLDPHRTTIDLAGRPLGRVLASAPDAGQSFDALTRRWRVDVARDPPTALQATLPWLVVAWPPVTALLIYLVGRGMLRRRRAERQVDDIFDLSIDLLCVASLDGYFKRVNPAFEHTLGYMAPELLSRPLLAFVHPDDRERTVEFLAALREGRYVPDFESRFIRADGAVRWLQWNARATPQTGLMYGAARDVTDNRMLIHEQAALRRVATLVAQGTEAGELFEAVAVEVGQLLGADAAHLMRYEEDGTASVVGTYSAPGAQIDIDSDLSLDCGLVCGRVAVAIVVAGRQWGAIVAAWEHPEMAGGDTEPRMAHFTELVATAVANAQSSAELAASRRRIVAAADDARRQIERDLHDGAQQRLVTTLLLLGRARDKLGAADGPARELVAEALSNAQQGLDEVRELARGIHPRILSSGGLGLALEMLARRSSVPVRIEARSDARLPDNVEVTAYYVVSEALTNAVKHAHASEVQITMDMDQESVVITISDDGCGGADPGRGSGLVGLQDRVAALGGNLAVHSPPGAGTVLTARIPAVLPAAAPVEHELATPHVTPTSGRS